MNQKKKWKVILGMVFFSCGLLTSPLETEAKTPMSKMLAWDPQWQYAEFSQIHTGTVTLYQISEEAKTIAVNGGHGTEGGSAMQTLCHPDGSPKVTGGTTASGAVSAIAVSGGTTMLDGTSEAEVNLKLAQILKEKLLEQGFNVCMIREDADVQLDNVARTVFANENADCHIALHFDSTENDKGFFYIGVPDVPAYKNMEPVAFYWMKHQELGEHILEGMKETGRKIFGSGRLDLDLTQTSYSTIPSVDLEVGDRGSDYSDENLNQIADGIVTGIQSYFS